MKLNVHVNNLKGLFVKALVERIGISVIVVSVVENTIVNEMTKVGRSNNKYFKKIVKNV